MQCQMSCVSCACIYLVFPGSLDTSSRRGSCPLGGTSVGARPRTRTRRRTSSRIRGGSPASPKKIIIALEKELRRKRHQSCRKGQCCGAEPILVGSGSGLESVRSRLQLLCYIPHRSAVMVKKTEILFWLNWIFLSVAEPEQFFLLVGAGSRSRIF